jgi:hypothetical protein
MKREELVDMFERWMRRFITVSYTWLTTDGEVLGYILAVLHFMISGMFYMLILISHTIYPSFGLQILVFVCVFIIWIQHVFLQVCISTIAEERFTNMFAPSVTFFNAILSLFGLKFSFHEYGTYFMIAETVTVGFLGLELVSRYASRLYKLNGMLY